MSIINTYIKHNIADISIGIFFDMIASNFSAKPCPPAPSGYTPIWDDYGQEWFFIVDEADEGLMKGVYIWNGDDWEDEEYLTDQELIKILKESKDKGEQQWKQ